MVQGDVFQAPQATLSLLLLKCKRTCYVGLCAFLAPPMSAYSLVLNISSFTLGLYEFWDISASAIRVKFLLGQEPGPCTLLYLLWEASGYCHMMVPLPHRKWWGFGLHGNKTCVISLAHIIGLSYRKRRRKAWDNLCHFYILLITNHFWWKKRNVPPFPVPSRCDLHWAGLSMALSACAC